MVIPREGKLHAYFTHPNPRYGRHLTGARLPNDREPPAEIFISSIALGRPRDAHIRGLEALARHLLAGGADAFCAIADVELRHCGLKMAWLDDASASSEPAMKERGHIAILLAEPIVRATSWTTCYIVAEDGIKFACKFLAGTT